MTAPYDFPESRYASSEEDHWCGWNCECCRYDDGTAPGDHMPSCRLDARRGKDCTCGYEEACWFVGLLLASLIGIHAEDVGA